MPHQWTTIRYCVVLYHIIIQNSFCLLEWIQSSLKVKVRSYNYFSNIFQNSSRYNHFFSLFEIYCVDCSSIIKSQHVLKGMLEFYFCCHVLFSQVEAQNNWKSVTWNSNWLPFVCNFTSTMEGHEYAMGMFFAIVLNKIITNNMWTQIYKTTSWEDRMLLFFMLHCTNKAWKNLVHGIEEWVHYIFCFSEL